MRWLLISSQYCASQGGIGAYVERFVSAAIERGWHVELMTRSGSGHPSAKVVHEIETLDRRPEFSSRIDGLRRIERIRPYRYALWSKGVAERLLQIRGKFDAIEFVDSQAEGFAAIGSTLVRQRFASTPMIVHAHTPMFLEEELNGFDLSRFGRPTYHQWERDSLRLADGVMVTSRLIADRLQLTNPVLVNPYPIKVDVNCVRGQDSHDIVLIGSVQPRKGVVEWVSSLNEVFRRSPQARGILIGPDTPTSPAGTSMVAYLRSQLKPVHQNRFQWHGARPHDRVMDCIKRAACVIVPSAFESFSFAAAEALCCGTPVIVSDQVGIREHVSGLPTFNFGDISGMATAQIDVLQDPASARQITLECRAQLLENCSPIRHSHAREQFVAVVKKSLRSRSPASSDDDSLALIERFVRSVEAAEECELASSVRS